MSKVSIKQQLILLIVVMTIIVGIVGRVGVGGVETISAQLRTVYEDRILPMQQLSHVSTVYGITVAAVAEQVMTGKLEWNVGLALIERDEQSAKASWAAYVLTKQLPEEEQLIKDMQPILKAADQALVHLKEILRAQDEEALLQFRLHELRVVVDPIAVKVEEGLQLQINETKRIYAEARAEAKTSKWLGWSLVLGGVLFGGLTGLWILFGINRQLSHMMEQTQRLAEGELSVRIDVREGNELGRLGMAFNKMADSLQDLVGKVQRSGIQVASSASELAASIKEQQATATEQAATATEVVASTKEIANTAKVLVRNMDEVAQGADTASNLAESGREDLLEMEATMSQMMDATQSISSRLAVLSEKANNIGSVVSTINKVADQTNLLSLNAAIEADKAGEHGIGFGVVATEIRRLADQTAVSTWDIEQMVKEMQSAVSSGVMSMEKFSEEVRRGVAQVAKVGERLARIVKSVQELTPHFESVYEVMQVQSDGAEQINLAIEQLSQTIQGTAQAMRESAQVVDQLNEASQRLQMAATKFKVGD